MSAKLQFLFPDPQLNYVGIVVASILCHFLGFFWYGKLFGKTWQMNSRWTPKKMAESFKDYSVIILAQFAQHLLTAFILCNFIVCLRLELWDSVVFTFFAWTAFYIASRARVVLWQGERPVFFSIGALYQFVCLELMVITYHQFHGGCLGEWVSHIQNLLKFEQNNHSQFWAY